MGKDDDIIQMLRDLQADGIFSTKEFYKDLVILLDSGEVKRDFIEIFPKDMKILDINAYNKFELLNRKLTEYQRRILDGNFLYRYEYRRNKKNIKCMFIIENDDESRILLNAFNEDWNKTKGNDSYKENIKRAIRIYDKLQKN